MCTRSKRGNVPCEICGKPTRTACVQCGDYVCAACRGIIMDGVYTRYEVWCSRCCRALGYVLRECTFCSTTGSEFVSNAVVPSKKKRRR